MYEIVYIFFGIVFLNFHPLLKQTIEIMNKIQTQKWKNKKKARKINDHIESKNNKSHSLVVHRQTVFLGLIRSHFHLAGCRHFFKLEFHFSLSLSVDHDLYSSNRDHFHLAGCRHFSTFIELPFFTICLFGFFFWEIDLISTESFLLFRLLINDTFRLAGCRSFSILVNLNFCFLIFFCCKIRASSPILAAIVTFRSSFVFVSFSSCRM